jgi:hypothetical protein
MQKTSICKESKFSIETSDLQDVPAQVLVLNDVGKPPQHVTARPILARKAGCVQLNYAGPAPFELRAIREQLSVILNNHSGRAFRKE